MLPSQTAPLDRVAAPRTQHGAAAVPFTLIHLWTPSCGRGDAGGRSSCIARSSRRSSDPGLDVAGGDGSSGSAPSSSSGAAWGEGWAAAQQPRARRRGAPGAAAPPKSLFGASTVPRQRTQQTPEQPSAQRAPQPLPPQQDAAAPPPDPALEASLRRSVDRAAETLQEVVTEVLNEMLVEQVGNYLGVQDDAGGGSGDGGPADPDAQMRQAARGALAKRLEWLDANFLGALNAYLALPGVRRDAGLKALLGAVRAELLGLVAARLPAPAQVLDAALAHDARDARGAVVSRALGGGGGALPGVSLGALGAAAAQLVDDMEEQQVVADRGLLARLVLLREELRCLAEEQQASELFFGGGSSREARGGGEPGGGDEPGLAAGPDAERCAPEPRERFFAFHRSNLPVRCAAFVKELLGVTDRTRRLGLLAKAFQEDWIGEAPPKAAAAQAEAPQPRRAGLRPIQPATGPASEALDVVRPGRFLATLTAMRAELAAQLASPSPASAPPPLGLLAQLDDVASEALCVLDGMQRARPGAAPGMGAVDYALAAAPEEGGA